VNATAQEKSQASDRPFVCSLRDVSAFTISNLELKLKTSKFLGFKIIQFTLPDSIIIGYSIGS